MRKPEGFRGHTLHAPVGGGDCPSYRELVDHKFASPGSLLCAFDVNMMIRLSVLQVRHTGST